MNNYVFRMRYQKPYLKKEKTVHEKDIDIEKMEEQLRYQAQVVAEWDRELAKQNALDFEMRRKDVIRELEHLFFLFYTFAH